LGVIAFIPTRPLLATENWSASTEAALRGIPGQYHVWSESLQDDLKMMSQFPNIP
jgi:hypothetical protein